MSNALEGFTKKIVDDYKITNSKSKDISDFIFDSAEKSLDEVVTNYTISGFSHNNMSRFITKFEKLIGSLVSENGNINLIKDSNSIIINKAKERNLPLDKKGADFHLKEDIWISRILNVGGLEERTRIEKSLEYIELLNEFYFGDCIFKKDRNIKSLNNSEKFEWLKKFAQEQKTESAIITENFEGLQTVESSEETEEERLICTLIKQGYLQCDLK